MGQTCAGEIILGEGEDLRLVLQTPKGAGKNNAIAIALKIGATRLAAGRFRASQLVCAKKLGPIHAARLPESMKGMKWENGCLSPIVRNLPGIEPMNGATCENGAEYAEMVR